MGNQFKRFQCQTLLKNEHAPLSTTATEPFTTELGVHPLEFVNTIGKVLFPKVDTGLGSQS